jgi:hypothetical protein
VGFGIRFLDLGFVGPVVPVIAGDSAEVNRSGIVVSLI